MPTQKLLLSDAPTCITSAKATLSCFSWLTYRISCLNFWTYLCSLWTICLVSDCLPVTDMCLFDLTHIFFVWCLLPGVFMCLLKSHSNCTWQPFCLFCLHLSLLLLLFLITDITVIMKNYKKCKVEKPWGLIHVRVAPWLAGVVELVGNRPAEQLGQQMNSSQAVCHLEHIKSH